MREFKILFLIAVSLLINSISSQVIKSELHNEKILTFPVKRNLNSKLNDFLEHKLRQMMIKGDEKFNLPVMDPLHGYDQQFDFNIDKIMVSAKANEYHAVGLSSYVVKGSNVNTFKRRIDVSMNFPIITAHGLYNLDGFVGENTPVFGTGDFNMTCTDFYYSATAYVSVFGKVQVKSLDLKISLKKLDLSMTGLMNDDQTSWILSEVFSDMIPKIIDQYHDEIVTIISAKVIEIINKNLNGMSITDLLGLLNGNF
ncbi:uncharacterized protein [Chelonus insularis]|nr:uncharacterized protein LOC118069555 isoform X2 [Chelonus insularis]